MDDTSDTADVLIHPPIAVAPKWLVPLTFLPADFSGGWLDVTVFALALALGVWAVVTLTRGGSNVPTNRPSITIVQNGPYRFTRNPIYLGMLLGSSGWPSRSTLSGC